MIDLTIKEIKIKKISYEDAKALGLVIDDENQEQGINKESKD